MTKNNKKFHGDPNTFYREVFERSRDGYVMVDAKGHILNANHAYCSMLGYTLEELKALDSFYEITPKRWHKWEEEEIWNKRLLKQGHSGLYEKEYIRKDGTIFPVELQSYVVFDEQGQLKYLWGVARDITEQKKVEEEREEVHRLLDAWMDNSPPVAFIKDLEGRITYVNASFEKLFSLAPGEIIGKTDYDLYPNSPETARRMQANDQKTIKEGQSCLVQETVMVDGKPQYFETLKFPLRNNEGEIIALAGMATDVTERVEVENELKASEEKYRRIVEYAHEGIWLIDADNKTTFVNSKMAEMLGYSAEEMLGKPLFSFMDEVAQQLAFQKVEKRKLGIAESHEFKFKRKDGSDLYALLSTTPLYGEDEEYLGAFAMIADISDRKEIENKLRESEEKFRRSFEASKVGMAIVDKNGRFLSVNKATFDTLQYSAEEFFKLSFLDITHPKDIERSFERFKCCLEDCEHYSIEKRYITKNGDTLWCLTTVSPISDSKGNFLYAIEHLQDITEQKRSYAALCESEEKFRQIAESIREVFWIASTDWSKVLYVSPGYEEIWGRPCQALYEDALDWFASVHPDDRERLMHSMWQNKGHGFLKEVQEYRIIRPDNSERYIRSRAFPVYGEEGEVIRIVGLSEDITEEKIVERELRDSKEKLSMALDVSEAGIWSWNLKTNELVIDEKFHRMLGYKPGELPLDIETWSKLHHPDEFDAMIARCKKHFRGETSAYESEHRILAKDGKWLWVFTRGRIVTCDAEGSAEQFVGVAVDISKRKVAERELWESEALLNQTGKIARIGGWRHDLKTGKATWTKALYDIVEIESGSPPGVNEHFDYYPPESRSILKQAYEKCIQEGHLFDLELECYTAKGRPFWCRAIGEAVYEDNECVALQGTFQDITLKKRYEERLRELSVKIVQIEEQERKRIAAGLHDNVAQNLALCKMQAGQLQAAWPGGEAPLMINSMRQALGSMVSEVRSLIFDISSPLLYEVGLEAALKELVEKLKGDYAVDCSLDYGANVQIPNQEQAVMLFQMARELVINAGKHAEAKNVSVNLAKVNEQVVLTVSDDGRGFPEQERSRAFSKQRSFGLFYIQERVDLLGGSLDIKSIPERGTDVVVSIPCEA